MEEYSIEIMDDMMLSEIKSLFPLTIQCKHIAVFDDIGNDQAKIICLKNEICWQVEKYQLSFPKEILDSFLVCEANIYRERYISICMSLKQENEIITNYILYAKQSDKDWVVKHAQKLAQICSVPLYVEQHKFDL